MNEKKKPYLIVTNRVSKTIEQIEEKVRFIGLNILNNHIINPLVALNKYIINNEIKTYFFVGTEFQKNNIIDSNNYEIFPDYVILCDFENIDCNYKLLNKIYQYIRNGSKILTTSYSDYYISDSEYRMDTGIFVKMFESLTGKKAVILGKPSTEILQIAILELNKKPKDIVLIGDDGFSDIQGGKQLGMETILVKTGVYKEGDEEKYTPNIVVNNLEEIIELI